jgi:aryl-alcohol dehydrogenase-like predicted oxidoreductase
MRYRTFGRTGWQISEVGYGMWGMAGWTGSDDEQSFALQLRLDACEVAAGRYTRRCNWRADGE